jgi:hypothetical protein
LKPQNKTQKKSKTPSPPKSKTPSPPKSKTPSPPKPILKTVSNLTKKHSKEKTTYSPSVIKWGDNEIILIPIKEKKKINLQISHNDINECPKKVEKKDFPCKHENQIFYKKREYKEYKLPKCILNKTKNNKFPCKTIKNRKTIIIDYPFELDDYIDIVVNKSI